ncbi:MAG: hypothetical protein NVSMB6_26360 [Burkholderiaceae bacterium]
MLWFKKGKQKELWDEVIQFPIGDLEAANRIRNICNSASSRAEQIGSQISGSKTKAIQQDASQFQRAAKAAMEIALKMSDDLLRESAVCQIVSLCLKASDLRTAVVLFRAVQSPPIRQDMLKEYPALREVVGC